MVGSPFLPRGSPKWFSRKCSLLIEKVHNPKSSSCPRGTGKETALLVTQDAARKNPKNAYLYAMGAVLLWSTVASAFKLTLRHTSPFGLLLFSALTSCAVLFALLVAGKKVSLLKKLGRKELLRSAVMGLLNPFLYYLILFEAYDRLPAQVAQPLNYTWAITLALLSVPLLKQRLLATDLVGALVSYLGVVVLSARSSLLEYRFPDGLGVALALGSTLIWAIYWIGNTRDEKDPVLSLFLNFAFGSLYLLAASPLFSFSLLNAPFQMGGWGLLGCFYVGVFEMGVAFYLWLKAMKLAESTARVSNLIFFSPFLSLVFIHFLVGEEIFFSTALGLPLIVAGTFIQRSGARRHPPSAPSHDASDDTSDATSGDSRGEICDDSSIDSSERGGG